ncbi:MAG: glycosyltransferase family 39 protein, partial [Anaerolineae bacterium]
MCAAERHRDWRLLLALALILLLALALRLYRLDGQSLWADEGNSAALAGRPFAVIAEQAALDIHPPLYYWLLKIWCSFFGRGETALRSLSVLFSLGVVALVYALGAELAGPTAGLTAALLAAISPLQVYYAQEARMYMLMALWSALAAWAAWRWIVHPRWPLALVYVLAGAAGLYTHYFFPAVLLVCNLVFLAAWLERRRARSIIAWTGMQAGVLLLYLPWLGTGLSRLLAWPRGTAAVDVTAWLGAAWRTLCLGPAGLNAPWSTALPFALLLVLGTAALAQAGRRGTIASSARWLLAVLGWLVPAALMAAGGIYQPARLKFLTAASPFFALCLGAGAIFPVQLARAGRRSIILSRFLAGLLVVLALIPAGRTLHRYYTDPTAARDDYRGMVEYIRATAGPDDAVILNAPGQWDVFSYYYRSDPWPVYRLPTERPPNRASLEQGLAELTGRHRRLYVLYWATDESDPERIMESWLDAHAFKGVERWFGNVRFVMYTTL